MTADTLRDVGVAVVVAHVRVVVGTAMDCGRSLLVRVGDRLVGGGVLRRGNVGHGFGEGGEHQRFFSTLRSVTGALTDLFLSPEASAPMRRAEHARALAGRGLEGDRYADSGGSFSRWPHPGRAITLIASEALADAEAEFGVTLADGEHRRNLVVTGVPLADLKGVAFRIGEVEFRGWRICAPCTYLIRVTGQDLIFEALVRRGGLRAEILTDGVIRRGDPVTWDPAAVANRRSLPG